ncbi:MAG: CoB--CoM heterodisulfide reductase iron-sulfur subunit A family protein [Bacteroidales bacterium]|nr:CoB--CoM heterodisulfide reductase iron-sulfur subunit A family protein [Bacteroidales bacterium]
MSKTIAVIGAGAAGLEASSVLHSLGYSVNIIEKSQVPGGHINNWNELFPDRRPASEVVDHLIRNIDASIPIYYNKEIQSVKPFSGKFIISAADGWVMNTDAVLITTGFKLFEAERKEEYGYGIYDHVITSSDLEKIFKENDGIRHRLGKSPARVGFVHCVGSRDEKSGNIYCSKVCCITAVKQAIEVKELFPDAEIFCFYMDLRMFGRHYEELYKEAQEKHSIQFIRGRLSESTEDMSGNIVVKVEDTLLGKPLKITVDMLVLMSGMEAAEGNSKLGVSLGFKTSEDRFLNIADAHLFSNISEVPGVFLAGTCTGPKTLTETLTDARSAALAIHDYLVQDTLTD